MPSFLRFLGQAQAPLGATGRGDGALRLVTYAVCLKVARIASP